MTREETTLKAWKWVCVIACAAVIVLGTMKARDVRADRQDEIQAYNQWMQLMLIANSHFGSIGQGEKPRKNSFYENPNMALILADKYLNMAGELEDSTAQGVRGPAAAAELDLGSIGFNLSQELGYMYDPVETYHNHQYRTGTPIGVLVRDRDYMNLQLSTILNGMPESVAHVSQIVKLEKRLKTILSTVGIFSAPYEHFMQSTGQMKAG